MTRPSSSFDLGLTREAKVITCRHEHARHIGIAFVCRRCATVWLAGWMTPPPSTMVKVRVKPGQDAR